MGITKTLANVAVIVGVLMLLALLNFVNDQQYDGLRTFFHHLWQPEDASRMLATFHGGFQYFIDWIFLHPGRAAFIVTITVALLTTLQARPSVAVMVIIGFFSLAAGWALLDFFREYVDPNLSEQYRITMALFLSLWIYNVTLMKGRRWLHRREHSPNQ